MKPRFGGVFFRALTDARADPVLARCAPFAVFIAMLMLHSAFPSSWLAALRGVLVGIVLLWFWRAYGELAKPQAVRANDWLLAAAVGAGVFVVWIGLGQGWAVSGERAGFNPTLPGGGIDWPLALLRLAGLAVVVPIMEELFWRSFLMRWIRQGDFLSLAPRDAGWKAIAITTVLFALEHNQWLAGGIAGLAYAWLYVRTANLWIPIAAHIITNGALGIWILTTASWQFW